MGETCSIYMNNLIKRIDAKIEKCTPLNHVFYQMWLEGKLNVAHLRSYSKEYFQLVKAVPKFVENISSFIIEPTMKIDVDQNLKEESEHIEPWIKFANAMGVPRNELINYAGASKTNNAVSDLTKLTTLSLEEGAAAMYAYEIELPKISRSKVDGLKKFYGINSTDATQYFEIHGEVDIRHASVWSNILQNTPSEKEEYVFNAASRSLNAQNKILDSVQEEYMGSKIYTLN
jgi:pyrroloquinoline-quinone synthase